jgi:hypothetical protein
MNTDKKFIKKIRMPGVHPKRITKYDIQKKIQAREEEAKRESEPKSE